MSETWIGWKDGTVEDQHRARELFGYAEEVLELPEKPNLVSMDIRTADDIVYRVFRNGVVDMGTPDAEPERLERRRTPAATAGAVRDLLNQLARELEGAGQACRGKAYGVRGENYASEFAHHFLADQARDVTKVLRSLAESIGEEGG